MFLSNNDTVFSQDIVIPATERSFWVYFLHLEICVSPLDPCTLKYLQFIVLYKPSTPSFLHLRKKKVNGCSYIQITYVGFWRAV
jgi:hypothetical protein